LNSNGTGLVNTVYWILLNVDLEHSACNITNWIMLMQQLSALSHWS